MSGTDDIPEDSRTDPPSITCRGVEFTVGDSLYTADGKEADIVGFSLFDVGDGNRYPSDGDAYWLLVETDRGETRWLAGSIAESIRGMGSYTLKPEDE
jgi:hypothetical protein